MLLLATVSSECANSIADTTRVGGMPTRSQTATSQLRDGGRWKAAGLRVYPRLQRKFNTLNEVTGFIERLPCHTQPRKEVRCIT
jgi:hypothetical protein